MTLRIVTVLLLLRLAPEDASAQKEVVRGTQIDGDVYGNIYVLDGERNTLRLYDREGNLRREIGGTGWENDQFDRPSGIWARNGIDVFVADFGNHRIQRFDRSLAYVSTFSTRDNANPDERFGYPSDVTLSRLGELFVCDTENSRIVKVDAQNKVERSFGGFGGGKGRLTSPSRLDAGARDAIYVMDRHRVAVFDAFGNFLHDLLPGVILHPDALYADPDCVLVADGGTLYMFDGEERPTGAVPLTSLIPDTGPVMGMVRQQGKLIILTGEGLRTLLDFNVNTH
jgi:DNA-binding beta-propeller fold protein YncE